MYNKLYHICYSHIYKLYIFSFAFKNKNSKQQLKTTKKPGPLCNLHLSVVEGRKCFI